LEGEKGSSKVRSRSKEVGFRKVPKVDPGL